MSALIVRPEWDLTAGVEAATVISKALVSVDHGRLVIVDFGFSQRNDGACKGSTMPIKRAVMKPEDTRGTY